MPDDETEPPAYSKAFEKIVRDDDDVVGLLAYALFKRAIKEDAVEGRYSSGMMRDPSRTVIETYRQAAQQTLSDAISGALEAARPELQASATLDAIHTSSANIREHVSARTGFLTALITNVVAWAFTLLITILVLLAFNRPDPAQTIKGVVDPVLPHAQPSR